MIITDPAVAVIEDAFDRHVAPILSFGRRGLMGRSRRAATSPRPFTSQAYAEAGTSLGAHRAGSPAPSQISATKRREAPLR